MSRVLAAVAMTAMMTIAVFSLPCLAAEAYVADDEAVTKAQGAVYYVCPDGDDLNPGTSDKPFRTLTHAVAMANRDESLDWVIVSGDEFSAETGEVFPIEIVHDLWIEAASRRVTIVIPDGMVGFASGSGRSPRLTLVGIEFIGGAAAIGGWVTRVTAPGKNPVENDGTESGE